MPNQTVPEMTGRGKINNLQFMGHQTDCLPLRALLEIQIYIFPMPGKCIFQQFCKQGLSQLRRADLGNAAFTLEYNDYMDLCS